MATNHEQAERFVRSVAKSAITRVSFFRISVAQLKRMYFGRKNFLNHFNMAITRIIEVELMRNAMRYKIQRIFLAESLREIVDVGNEKQYLGDWNQIYQNIASRLKQRGFTALITRLGESLPGVLPLNLAVKPGKPIYCSWAFHLKIAFSQA